MANYIGNIPSQGEFKKLDSIASSFDGSTTEFNLTYNTVSQPVGGAEQLVISLNGVVQEPLSAYTLGVGGASIVFSSAPSSGDTCHIVLFGGIGQTVTPSDQSVTPEKLSASLKDYYEDEFTADGSATTYTLTRESTGVNQLLVTVDGIVQPTSAYSVSSTTLTISPALPNGTNVRVVHMGVKSGVFVPAQNSIGLNELDLTALDGRYYTETESDSRYVQSASNFSLSNDRAQHQTRLTTQKLTGLGSTGRIDITGDNDVSLGLHVLDNVNVGIGTTAPSTYLDVEGANARIDINETSTGTPQLQFQVNGSEKANIKAGSGGTLQFSADLDQRFSIGGSESGRFDSNGSFLVGSTNSNLGSSSTEEGIVLNATGTMASSRSGNIAAVFNRLSSDGNIVELRKDGTTVGSIGVSSGTKLYVGAGDAALRFDPDNNVIRPHNASTNGSTDATLDIGNSSNRFKDLYLSGGIQFDSRSNKLDDYEEGTFTPYWSGSTNNITATYSNQQGNYTKVGNLVHIDINLRTTALSGGGGATGDRLRIKGLPYSATGTGSFVSNFTNIDGASNAIVGQIAGDTLIVKEADGDINNNDLFTNDLGTGNDDNQVWISMTYRTTA